MEHPEAPEGKFDKWGFTIKPTITDEELILICLKNAPEGTDKKQTQRLIKSYESVHTNERSIVRSSPL